MGGGDGGEELFVVVHAYTKDWWADVRDSSKCYVKPFTVFGAGINGDNDCELRFHLFLFFRGILETKKHWRILYAFISDSWTDSFGTGGGKAWISRCRILNDKWWR